MLIRRPRPHHVGLRRIGIRHSGKARHLFDGQTDDHQVRARLDPMIAGRWFGSPGIGVAHPRVASEHENKSEFIGRQGLRSAIHNAHNGCIVSDLGEAAVIARVVYSASASPAGCWA